MDLTRYAFIALGANLPGNAGHPLLTLKSVLPKLALLSDAALVVSHYYESDPKDCPPGSARYCNAVLALHPGSGTTALMLLHQLQALEAEYGRQRSGLLNEARTLDLDILTFPGTESTDPELTLPHPRAHERRFVLQPWIDVAGAQWRLHDKSLGDWLALNADPALITLE